MFCTVMVGIAVMRCGLHVTLREYREGLRHLARLAGSRSDLPMMIDIRAWDGNASDEIVARRVAVLLAMLSPSETLRVAVLTAHPAALREVAMQRRARVVVASLQTVDAARSWLSDPPAVEARGGELARTRRTPRSSVRRRGEPTDRSLHDALQGAGSVSVFKPSAARDTGQLVPPLAGLHPGDDHL